MTKEEAFDWIERNLGPTDFRYDSSSDEFVVDDIIDNEFRGKTLLEAVSKADSFYTKRSTDLYEGRK